jgi:hypothetical protein
LLVGVNVRAPPILFQVPLQLQVTGTGRTIMIDAPPVMTAARLSRAIEKQTGVPRGSFALYHAGKPMCGTLKESGVASGSTVELKFRGRGGGPEPQPDEVHALTHGSQGQRFSSGSSSVGQLMSSGPDMGLPSSSQTTNSLEVEIEPQPARSVSLATKVMRSYDRDGDGKFSQNEVHAMARDFIKEKKTRRLATKAAIAMAVLILLTVGLNAGLTAAIVFLSKDLKVSTGGMLTPDDKQVAKVAVAKQFIPLGLASYMTQSELLTIDKVALSKSSFNPTDNTSTPYQASYTVLGYEWFSYHHMYFTLSDGGRVRITDGNAWCVHLPSHSYAVYESAILSRYTHMRLGVSPFLAHQVRTAGW